MEASPRDVMYTLDAAQAEAEPEKLAETDLRYNRVGMISLAKGSQGYSQIADDLEVKIGSSIEEAPGPNQHAACAKAMVVLTDMLHVI